MRVIGIANRSVKAAKERFKDYNKNHGFQNIYHIKSSMSAWI